MNLKSIFHFSILLTLPLIIYGKNDDPSEILVLTTESNGNTGDYASAMQTFIKYEIPYNVISISQGGISNEELENNLFTISNTGSKIPKYKVLVFPNGRISYDHADYSQTSQSDWQSALRYDQWELFYDYSRSYGARLVFLNEYPSNYTSTSLYREFNEEEAKINYQLKQRIIAEKGITEEETINNSILTTSGIYHFPAKIVDYGNGVTAEPLLYFGETLNYPEKTVAAVTVNNNGALYVAFFMAFGEWSSTSTALNIVWLTWATQKDLKYTSNKKVTTKEAIEENSYDSESSGLRKYGKSECNFIIIFTILAIFINLL
ncbi:hypothetical protein BCR36DRAFT_411849 [Piromyces finnis]|uniref:Agd3 CBM87 domain-containing protein n=1 Tax=Piromyces finnis TaxID=1754191 RepID=A0A1Y1VAI9_9FUNG|nr:hypothetical protein BCR36DRAFT_411849 [Piromyces finnis]|eukprot:ORX51382.1 hypothetical protein BCR36DRAFT_411849 [Piromyces finnis]